MKILFVIKMVDFGDYVSVSYLSSIAKERHHDVHICIMDNDDIFKMVDSICPNIIAYSANILGYKDMVDANKELKKTHNFISIMGGPHPTFAPELFTESGMDVFCVGEGELAFSEFLDRVEKNESFDDVLNLITIKGANPIRPLVDNLDDLPLPDRGLTIEHSFLKNSSKKSVFTSRGCPYSCSYCHNEYYKKLYKGKGKIVRRFSVDRIIKEIKILQKNYVIDFLKFGDDLFAAKADDWLKEFSKRYAEEIKLPFNCYLRLDMVNDDLLSLLRDAGCYSVHLSIDSCSRYVREEILHRQWKDVDIEQKLKLIHSYGINTWVNFMLAAPESTVEDDLETIFLARKTKIKHLNYSTTIPIKNTELFNYCVKNGLINEDYNGDIGGASGKSPLRCFSDKEKNIRYNIFCLGSIAAKSPQPFSWLIIKMIKIFPSNRLFRKMKDLFWKYTVNHYIFKLKD